MSQNQTTGPRPALFQGAALAVAFWASLLLTGGTALGAQPEDGKEVFLKKNCSHCHSVMSEGIERGNASKNMQGSDLSDVGSQYTRDEMLIYLKRGDVLPDNPVVRTEAVDKGEHWKTFWGSAEEAEALVEWLLGLRLEKQTDEATSQE